MAVQESNLNIRNAADSAWVKANASSSPRNRFKVRNAADNAWLSPDIDSRVKIRNAANNAWIIPEDYAVDIRFPDASTGEKARSFFAATRLGVNVYVWGSTDSAAEPVILYNKWISGGWENANSTKIIEYVPVSPVTVGGFKTDTTTIAIGDVLYDETAPFKAPNGSSYKYVLYWINQPYKTTYVNPSPPPADIGYWNYHDTIDGNMIQYHPGTIGWGMVYVSYSNSIDSGWVTSQFIFSGAVLLGENVSAVYYNSKIYMTIVEGSITTMITNKNAYSYGAIAEITPGTNCSTGTAVSSGYFSKTSSPADAMKGYNPGKTLTSPNTTDDHPIVFNITTALDVTNRLLYMARAYAYPLDFDDSSPATGEIPCLGTTIGLGSLPNRCQLFKIDLGNPIDFANVYTNTWTLVKDYGYNVGVIMKENGVAPCDTEALKDSTNQLDIGGDVNTLCMLRDESGNIHDSHILVAGIDKNAVRTLYGSSSGSADWKAYTIPFNL